MRPEVVIAVVSAVVSLVSVLLTAVATHRTTVTAHRLQQQSHQQAKVELAEELFRRYREPLLWSAQSLQSRIYNGIGRGFLHRYLHCGDPEDERYARDNTVFVLAEYLGWLEIIRRDQRFWDREAIVGAGSLFKAIGQTQHVLATEAFTGPFRLFRGQQRALGELMLTRTESSEVSSLEVMGYAAFCGRLDDDPQFAKWFDRLRTEVDTIEAAGYDGNTRLARLQDSLLDLIKLLDPAGGPLAVAPEARLPAEPGPLPQLQP
ncbi:hypothetical protein ABGB16_10235 [Micromonospora sp. B11E3]|uniref:hypothetical protein n=1 Tax=Micromonospora sp. B11E3 TaxID=3153562 RepID=UPI00325C4243